MCLNFRLFVDANACFIRKWTSLGAHHAGALQPCRVANLIPNSQWIVNQTAFPVWKTDVSSVGADDTFIVFAKN